MIVVPVKDGENIERALKKFKRKFERTGVIKELRHQYPESNIVAIDYDPGASEVNQLNRIKLMLSTANKNLK